MSTTIPVPYEKVEQDDFAKWLRFNGYVFAHVPNETRGSAGWARAMLRRGMQTGFPDYLIFGHQNRNGEFKPLHIAIELKRKKGGRESDEQTAWIDKLRGCGWRASVCAGSHNAIEFVLAEDIGRV